MESSIEGFRIYPVQFNTKSANSHYLYLKPHKVKNSADEKPPNRTLLVIGIPPYVNKECLSKLFSHFGEITSVFFQKKPSCGPPPSINNSRFSSDNSIKGFKVAYVVFTKEKSVSVAMEADNSEQKTLSTKKDPIATGIKKWMKEYNNSIVDTHDLQTEIDEYLEKYDKKVEEERLQEKEKEGVPDNDGWITVSKSKHGTTAPHTEAVNRKVTKKEKAKRRQKELRNFYAFQIRDSKMQHINQLREKFEEDKKRILAMKASRKFRPY